MILRRTAGRRRPGTLPGDEAAARVRDAAARMAAKADPVVDPADLSDELIAQVMGDCEIRLRSIRHMEGVLRRRRETVEAVFNLYADERDARADTRDLPPITITEDEFTYLLMHGGKPEGNDDLDVEFAPRAKRLYGPPWARRAVLVKRLADLGVTL